jgi:hypothetical protein
MRRALFLAVPSCPDRVADKHDRRGQHWRARVSATRRTLAGVSPVIDTR